MNTEFKSGDPVIWNSQDYDFAYYNQEEGHCILYEKGCKNMQDSFAVKVETVKFKEHDCKKRVSSSNLALRFYLKNGWTRELLESLIISGGICCSAHWADDSIDQRYYLPEFGTELDVPKLMEHVSSVYRAFDDYPKETDEEFIRRML